MVSSWAVDLKDMAAVYPWLGLEGAMVIAATVAWIVWHYLQIRGENREFAEDKAKFGDKESIRKAIEEFPA